MAKKNTTTETSKSRTLAKFLPWLLIIAGTIGLICAFIIMYEKIALLQNPQYTPSCNLNPVISCGSVMASDQAHAFGFPNPMIGLIAFPVVMASGVVLLGGATLKRWYWLGLQAGSLFGVLFVHWLFYQSVYNIHALCPYCMVVWVVTISTFWYVSLYNLGLWYASLPRFLQRATTFMRRHHLDILLLWFLVITFFILKHFWYYYSHFL
jgi:uncharacterized membrane protein